MKSDKHIYLKLFISTFYLSAFTFGGGYVIVPLMKRKFVDDYGWIDENEVLDLIAIAQSSPGAIAVNASIILGYQIAGVLGSVVSIFGTILPPLIILSIISNFYDQFKSNTIVRYMLKGMQAGVGAVIINVVIRMGKNEINSKRLFAVLLMVITFTASFIFNVNVIIIILFASILGVIYVIYKEKKRGEL